MTSLVAAVLEFFGVVALKEQRGLDLVHSVAQYVHCFAQGKIGSGFDVSAAVYGSHVYRRFDPLSLEPLMTPVWSPPFHILANLNKLIKTYYP